MKIFYLSVFLFFVSSSCEAQPFGVFTSLGQGQLNFMADSNLHLNRYKGFIVGELHDLTALPEIKLALIKHMHGQRGINDVFMEIGTGAAWLYNQYLATGDTTYITHPALVYASKNEGRIFWEGLYRYNAATGHKLIIHGFDFERMEFLKVMKLLKPANRPIPADISGDIRYVDTVSLLKVNDLQLVSIYNRFKASVALHEPQYKTYYGSAFTLINSMVRNNASYEHYINRNRDMYSNTAKILKEQHIRQYVLFAGVRHCDKSDVNSLCGLLMNDADWKGYTANIAMLYIGGKGTSRATNKMKRRRIIHSYHSKRIVRSFESLAQQGIGCKFLLVRVKKQVSTVSADYQLFIR